MESRAKLLGHPIHPMLIVLPFGLFISSIVFDVIYFITDRAGATTVSFWNIAAGIVGGLLAAVFGFRDWLAIPDGTRAKRIGLWHGAGNLLVVALFAASLFLRRDNPGHAPGTLEFLLSLVAIGLGAITGWLGGELVDRLGVGVDPGANLDAPSSLSGLPADSNRPTASTALYEEPLKSREVGK